MQIIKKMESQNGGAAPSRCDTKRESQQLADAQELIRELEGHLANTGEVLAGGMMRVERLTLVLERKESELNKRMNERMEEACKLREKWKKYLEKEKRKHDLELEQLKEEVRSGNQIRESLEQKIKRGEKSLEQRKEELLGKSRRFEEMREAEERKTKLEEEKRKHDLELKQLKEEVRFSNQIGESLEQKITSTDTALTHGAVG